MVALVALREEENVSIALLVIAGVVMLSTLFAIGSIGKRREPLTGRAVVVLTVLNLAIVIFMVLAAIQLGA